MTVIPTLKTDRLVLRPMQMSDFDSYAAFVASDRAAYMGGPLDRATAWNWFASDTAHWHLFGFGGLMITLTDGTLVGQVSVTKGVTFPEAELGWFLFAGFEGKGFGTEAATALRKWVYDFADLTTLVSYVSPENSASVHLAERMDAHRDHSAAVPEGETSAQTHVYRHPSADLLGDGGMEAYA